MFHAGKNPKAMYDFRRPALSPGHLESKPWAKVGAWYIGPKAGNEKIYKEMALDAVNEHLDFRKNYFPSDPAYITDDIKNSASYIEEIENLRSELATMRQEMKKSVPYFSPRYKVFIWEIKNVFRAFIAL